MSFYGLISLVSTANHSIPTRKGAFQGVNIRDMPDLAHFREDMVFAESRFWGNEAVFGGL